MTTSHERTGFSILKDRAGYWHLTQQEQLTIWTNIIAQGLKISVPEAFYKISQNNSLPIESENDGDNTFPRFVANANLLAQASPHNQGPRGPRPSLASAANVLRISGITRRQVGTYGIKLVQETGGIGKFLLKNNLTAANPKQAPTEVSFSDTDIRDGIYIPNGIDIATARALGLVYGSGSLGNGSNLALSSPIRDRRFYELVVRKAFEAAFNFPSNQNIRIAENRTRLKEEGYKFLQVTYASKALKTYLLKHIGFPESRDARKEKGITPKIKSQPSSLQDEFLKYFLAASAVFDWNQGLLRIADVSELILKDIEQMIGARVTKQSISVREGSLSNHTILSLSTIPSMELFLLGYLSVNPRIKGQVEVYYNERLRSRAHGYLKRTYPDRVE